jgi:hypothetical protein
MTTGRINQVTILRAERLGKTTPRINGAEQFTERRMLGMPQPVRSPERCYNGSF